MRILWETLDAARLLNLSTESVRALEQVGKLPAVARTPRGLRLFDPAAVERLRVDREAKKAGRA